MYYLIFDLLIDKDNQLLLSLTTNYYNDNKPH
jgi:hypothetical protein